jgi:hypothetical protein
MLDIDLPTAIRDGHLLDISETARERDSARRITRAAWDDCVASPKEAEKRKGFTGQSEAGRPRDVVTMTRFSAAQTADPVALVQLYRVPVSGDDREAQLTELVAMLMLCRWPVRLPAAQQDGCLGQHSGPRSAAAGRSTPSSTGSSATTWPSAHPTTWPPRSTAASPNGLLVAEDQPETAMSSRRNVVGVASSSVLVQARVTVRPRYGVRSTD